MNWLVFGGIGLITYLGAPTRIEPAKPAPNATFSGVVKWVTDGDTFLVDGHDWPVRVWGIDAPERDTDAGVTSRAYLTDMIKGQVVRCDKVVVDQYKRTVARCYQGDNDIGAMMIATRQAQEYCSFSNGAYGTC
ncbi:thermonuclease family protein [Paramylibacter ulvae]|nr:thermonuclease family protein [Amylibacter ulvae]